MELKAQDFRDGISQSDRVLAALDPDSIAIDEQTVADWLQFAQDYAKNLVYFNDQNQPAGDWSTFFAGDAQELASLLTAIAANADLDEETIAPVAKPHLALLLTFLTLLRYPQAQFKALTQRRLDFYYRRVLQLVEKAAQPDRAHVGFTLAANEQAYLLPAGTRLNAGNDAQGQTLTYITESDLMITPAQVASLKTLSVETVYIDLETIHRQQNRTDAGFEAMLRWGLGWPNQGDPLPQPSWSEDPEETFGDLLTMAEAIQGLATDQISDIEQDYILNQLGFSSVAEFQRCFAAHRRENGDANDPEIEPPTEQEWQQVYGFVAKAFRRRFNQTRRDRLKQAHQGNPSLDANAAFLNLWSAALGDPAPGDPLPFFREQSAVDLNALLAEVQGDEPEAADRFIQESLYLSAVEFERIMAVQANFAQDWTAAEWLDVYRVLERAASQKHRFTYPDIGRTERHAIQIRAIADAEPDTVPELPRFHPLLATEQSDNSGSATEGTAETIGAFGVAIASPVLILQEGTRTITVTLAFDPETFDRPSLITFLEQADDPFRLALSSEAGWLSLAPEQWDITLGDFFLSPPFGTYNAADFLVTAQAADAVFRDGDRGQYLQLTDGGLYRIDAVLPDQTQVRLTPVGALGRTSNQVCKYGSLELQGEATPLANPDFDPQQLTITTPQNAFTQADAGGFIVWSDGTIYHIAQYNSRRKVTVAAWGYLPAPAANSVCKYQRLAFKLRGTAIAPTLPIKKITFTEAAAREWTPEDLRSQLAWSTGQMYRLLSVIGEVEAIGQIQRTPATPVEHYTSGGLYLNSLRFTVSLDDAQPAIVPLVEPAFATTDPILQIAFSSAAHNRAYYKIFNDLCLERVNVQVAVQDLLDLQLRNDRTILKPTSPVEPFGSEPVVGNSFYFAHPEIITKPLDALTLKLDWMGLPEDFATHYAAYCDAGLAKGPTPLTNESFTVRLDLLLSRNWHPLGEQSLFATTAGQLTNIATLTYAQAPFQAIPFKRYAGAVGERRNDLFEQSRYFRLELSPTPFQHDRYGLVLSKLAITNATNAEPTTVYPPYTPTLKSIAIDYQASAEIDLIAGEVNGPTGQIFQLNPFGCIDFRQTVAPDDPDPSYALLPQYAFEGSLYIGLRDLHAPQSLTLLFQMVAGSGDADLTPPTVDWSYLAGDRWQPFQPDELLSDGTNGFLDSGILQFLIPEQADTHHYVMPTGLHWLRATVAEHPLAIPECLDIRAQVVTVTFVDQGNDPEHLSTPLAADSIQSFVEQRAAIATLSQPYSSFGGRRQERDRTFYTRVSERLRHKQRALTRWDYEHLVLEAFPQIYKVKCLTQAEQPRRAGSAEVMVVVVPNLTNAAPFLPLAPKVPQYLLREIETYLQERTSPFVKVRVKNPHYEPIQYRVAVKFYSASDHGYYMQKLNEELVRFLSPWAYEEQSDISFGSSIHSSTVVHFIETRPYVDYVANLKLIEQIDLNTDPHSQTENVIYQVNPTGIAKVKRVDSILVSAPKHIIDLITTSYYVPEAFEGIGYMALELDFVVT
ncbi:MAG: baseplate J/gp47 family protein [Cyanobacteria bacterium P01_G01_bin.54]